MVFGVLFSAVVVVVVVNVFCVVSGVFSVLPCSVAITSPIDITTIMVSVMM